MRSAIFKKAIEFIQVYSKKIHPKRHPNYLNIRFFLTKIEHPETIIHFSGVQIFTKSGLYGCAEYSGFYLNLWFKLIGNTTRSYLANNWTPRSNFPLDQHRTFLASRFHMATPSSEGNLFILPGRWGNKIRDWTTQGRGRLVRNICDGPGLSGARSAGRRVIKSRKYHVLVKGHKSKQAPRIIDGSV